MATNPIREQSTRNWSKRSGAMSEEEFHELERLNPDRKYEYINGIAYMMSGGTKSHDRIRRNVDVALDRQFLSGPCLSFGVDVQVLLGTKKSGKPHFVYPDATISCAPEDRDLEDTLVQLPRVVIEVLSPGTERRDRGVKFRAYQNCPTIQEIVLVSQHMPCAELGQRDEQDSMLGPVR